MMEPTSPTRVARSRSLLPAAAALLASLGAAGCCAPSPRCGPCPSAAVAAAPVAPVPARASAAPAPVQHKPRAPLAHAFFHGRSGARLDFPGVLAKIEDADVVAFGELHEHPVGARYELEVLRALAAGKRPAALAMEFLERDVQRPLDDYLAGRITEAEFSKVARQGPAYAKTHRPLVEFCKEKGIPVIAANAPRRLVTDFRKSEKPYAEWLGTLPEADRALLPAESAVLDDEYRSRFLKAMGPDRGVRLLRGQSLWDDAMADAVAKHRTLHPESRVLLVVGGFHVQSGLGTVKKTKTRRPDDKVRVLLMQPADPHGPAFSPDDRGEGDVILKVEMPERPATPAKPPVHPDPAATKTAS